MTKLSMMDEQISKYIASQPWVSISVNGERHQGKHLENVDLIVRISINIPSEMFLNRDICRVIAILQDDRIVVKNLEDGRMGIVQKAQIKYPSWNGFPF